MSVNDGDSSPIVLVCAGAAGGVMVTVVVEVTLLPSTMMTCDDTEVLCGQLETRPSPTHIGAAEGFWQSPARPRLTSPTRRFKCP